MLWNNEKRRTIAFTLTPKATPVFTFAKALLKVAFAKVLLALGAGDASRSPAKINRLSILESL